MLYSSHMPTAWKVVFFPERMNQYFAFTPGNNNSPSAHVARIAVSLAWSDLLKKQLFGAWKVVFFSGHPQLHFDVLRKHFGPDSSPDFLEQHLVVSYGPDEPAALIKACVKKFCSKERRLTEATSFYRKGGVVRQRIRKVRSDVGHANKLQAQAGKAGTCASLVQLFKWIRCSRTGRHGFRNTGRDVTTKAKQDLNKKQVCRGRGG